MSLRSKEYVQTDSDLLGHNDIFTWMVEKHVQNRSGHDVRSLFDIL